MDSCVEEVLLFKTETVSLEGMKDICPGPKDVPVDASGQIPLANFHLHYHGLKSTHDSGQPRLVHRQLFFIMLRTVSKSKFNPDLLVAMELKLPSVHAPPISSTWSPPRKAQGHLWPDCNHSLYHIRHRLRPACIELVF